MVEDIERSRKRENDSALKSPEDLGFRNVQTSDGRMCKEGHNVFFQYLLFYFWVQVFFKNQVIAFYKYENYTKTPLMLNTYSTNVPLLNP